MLRRDPSDCHACIVTDDELDAVWADQWHHLPLALKYPQIQQLCSKPPDVLLQLGVRDAMAGPCRNLWMMCWLITFFFFFNEVIYFVESKLPTRYPRRSRSCWIHGHTNEGTSVEILQESGSWLFSSMRQRRIRRVLSRCQRLTTTTLKT